MRTSPYSTEFFQSHREGAWRSARATVPLIIDLLALQSVIDVGCGQGTWLAVFNECGVANVFGVDGEYIDRERLEISAECFLAHDLQQPLRLARQYDLAMSLEVAEHLPPESGDGLVASLVQLAPVVLFSAAAPFQGGTHHVNEQWPAYWSERFATHNYLPIDCLRRKLWNRDDVEWWYAQNMLLYGERGFVERHHVLLHEHKACPKALSLVHPHRYLEWVEWGIAQSQRSPERAAVSHGDDS
jgi:SAM-dependent methyltransferase